MENGERKEVRMRVGIRFAEMVKNLLNSQGFSIYLENDGIQFDSASIGPKLLAPAPLENWPSNTTPVQTGILKGALRNSERVTFEGSKRIQVIVPGVSVFLESVTRRNQSRRNGYDGSEDRTDNLVPPRRQANAPPPILIKAGEKELKAGQMYRFPAAVILGIRDRVRSILSSDGISRNPPRLLRQSLA